MKIQGNKALNSIFNSLLFFTIFYMTVFMPAYTSIPGLSNVLGLGTFFLLFLYLLIYRVNLKEFISFEMITYLLFLFFVFSVGYIVTVNSKIGFIYSIVTFMQKSMLLLVVAIWIGVTKSIKGICRIIVLNALLGGIISLINSYYIYGRLSLSLSANPNDLAYIMLSGIIAFFVIMPDIKLKNSWLVILILVFSNYIIFLTGSRKNLALSVICLLLYIFLQRSKLSFLKGVFKYTFILLIIISIMWISYSDFFVDSKLTRDSTESDLTRVRMYDEALKIFEEYPIFGVGYNGYKIISGMGTYSHSTYMEVLSNTGLVGFVIYFSIYVSIFFKYINHLYFLRKYPDEKIKSYMMFIMFLNLILLGFAVVHTYSLLSNILLGIVIGHTLLFKRHYYMEKE
ncbi:O-antigen ligase family protein [Priestia megaterium]|uniref:O-antigen ligase family protein n=1 Tax=Priestia megaterium TaxID=1404 RepID=UPI00285B6576|nr:O-antigen ligase family protein [Priestia megaterium]MDR7204821.1 O-antigen ligase [Priestia megaterium]